MTWCCSDLCWLNNAAVMRKNGAFYPGLSILAKNYLAITALYMYVPSEWGSFSEQKEGSPQSFINWQDHFIFLNKTWNTILITVHYKSVDDNVLFSVFLFNQIYLPVCLILFVICWIFPRIYWSLFTVWIYNLMW